MKKILLTFSVLFFAMIGFAQGQAYPKGVYMSFDEIKARTPSVQMDLNVQKRTKGDIFMNGGNDYKLTTEDKSVKRSFLRKKMLGYSDGDTLYLNCLKLKTQPWYAKIIEGGKYLIFRAGVLKNSKIHKQQQQDEEIADMLGGFGGLHAASAAKLRFVYAFDLDSNKLIMIDSNSLKALLKSNTDLLESYQKEPHQKNQEIQIKYLQLLNQTFR